MMAFWAVFLLGLSASDLERISKYNRQGLRDVQEWEKPKIEPEIQRAYGEARKEFSGRGPEVARHFLIHTDTFPAEGSIFFVLESVGDTETALILIRALADPPVVKSGPLISIGKRSWFREREGSEIERAIQAALVNEAVQRDPRIASEIVEVVASLRKRPGGISAAAAAVPLLGICRSPEASKALEVFSEDPDSSIRALSVEALGQRGGFGEKTAEAKPPTIHALLRTLQRDPVAEARFQAATSLGNLNQPETIQPLRDALQVEKEARVVDALVGALSRLGASPEDPQACREIVGRSWEPSACQSLFERWRVQATPEEILEAATSGPPVLRALAMNFMVQVPVRPKKWASLVPEEPPPPVELKNATRERLLSSAMEALSQKEGKDFSDATVQMIRDAFWEASGRNMDTALRYADRIHPVRTRYTTYGRYAASHDLWLKDRASYISYRRLRQTRDAILIAFVLSFSLIFRRLRRFLFPLTISIFAWGVWSLFQKEVRELPPPPLQFLTVSFTAFLSAGIACGFLGFLLQAGLPISLLPQRLGRMTLFIMGSAGLAFAICAFSRWNYHFPIGGEGWELIFDPIGCAILAAVISFFLGLFNILIFRFQDRSASQSLPPPRNTP